MRKVLAVASVGTEHKELVFKELKKIFRRIKISLDVLLQEEAANSATSLIENGNVFRSYPYITLTIPNYEQHRQCTSPPIQTFKRPTRTTYSSASSFYSSPKATTTMNSSTTGTKKFSNDNAGTGTTQSVARSILPQSSQISKNS